MHCNFNLKVLNLNLKINLKINLNLKIQFWIALQQYLKLRLKRNSYFYLKESGCLDFPYSCFMVDKHFFVQHISNIFEEEKKQVFQNQNSQSEFVVIVVILQISSKLIVK